MGIRPRRIADPEEGILGLAIVRELLNEEGAVVDRVHRSFDVMGVMAVLVEAPDPGAVIGFRVFPAQRCEQTRTVNEY